ncbi:MAG: alpha/beta fold hydrolase [Candidatus Lernaella stagnicola]|nr:alpha/beta fold hydrolase [Candidatus Lernaella stagnicola]
MNPFSCQAPDDVEIVGAVFSAIGAPRGTVVLCHGLPAGRPTSAEGAADDEGYPGLARRVATHGFHVAIFNFRGTGPSGGHLDIDLWPQDLVAVLDHLDTTPLHRPNYAVAGFSAGGAASILAAENDRRIDPLITFAAPADYSFLPLATDAESWFAFYRDLDMIRDGYPDDAAGWASRFARMVPRDAIGNVHASRIVLIHGTADDVVPLSHLDALAAAAGDKAERIVLPGGIHQMRKDERAVSTLIKVLNQSRPTEG